ncbi:LacI family transcriptional regulator [Halolactibacillus halophilus]|uniref:LacI family transcriptional regulator n=1 Tax=Halolactibacillus halophilus TaxID=306540 RepID=A0A1I5N1R0_9BACI|nr:LacI family DNA-binding transcriptional regulator [Halolactibacillus halophilus]GEM01087.1 LacI family transcriptional regulator [Halolactibacillus halophilus]SFP15768.1 LacI family transcriptional regulator [Halolactibacillus halophilus]
MATIKDVAKHANVSVATVSRYLNKKGYLSKEAEQKVKEAIGALNYKPNSVARSLYHKTSKMLGLVIPDITNPFFPELARAVEDVALTYGYTVVICNTDEDIDKEKHYIEALKSKYVDGLIIATHELSEKDYLDLGIPLVMLDRTIGEAIPSVRSNNREGAKLGTKYLIEQGCQFIAHVRGPLTIKTAYDRYLGFKDVVDQHQTRHEIVESAFDIDESKQKILKILNEYPEIDGIFTSSDVMAVGALKATQSLGLHVPEDIQIIGFDGIPLGEMLIPSLTTISQSIYKMGTLACRLLIKQIEKKPLEELHFVLETELKIRETTRGE